MALPSLARLSIEGAAPTAAPSDAPSDAPAPLATPSFGDVLKRLAQQEQNAGDAAHAVMQEMVRWAVNGGSDETVGDMRTRLGDRDLRKTAREALDTFMDAGVRGVARALVPGPDDPREVDDAVVSLEWMLEMWNRYAIAQNRANLRESFHASAQERGLYTVLVDILGRGLEMHWYPPMHGPRHDRCMLLVVAMTGNLSGTFASVGSAHAVDSNIHRLARTALAEASNGRIGSHLLASLANDMSTNIEEEYALTALLDLTYTPYITPNRPPDDSSPEPMTSTSAALAADENIVILFQMFKGMNADTRPSNIRNAALRVLSNVLYYNNGQTEPSPLLEQLLEHDTVKTITHEFGFVTQPNTTTWWLQTMSALAFLERFLFALKGASGEVLDRAFAMFQSQETAFVPTMLAYWKGVSLAPGGRQIGQTFSLFGQLDERYEKEAQKWQLALTDQGVYDYLETTLKEIDASRGLNNQSVTVHIDLLKYTLLPTPELWQRAKAWGLLDWMVEAATVESHNLTYAMKNQHTLHSVLSQIAAKNSGVAEWLLSNIREGTRRDRLLHCWAPKQYGSNIVAYVYASGFRALLCHGVAFDLVTTRNAQRVSGASVYTLPEGSEQWDWDVVEYILKDPNIIELAAVQGPAPSTGAAILMTLHILDVLNEDPQATMFEGSKDEKPEDKLVRRNTKWAELLHQFKTLHVGDGDGQLAGQLNKLINLVTELLQNPGPSNSAYILSQREWEGWVAQEVPEQPTKRARTTDAVYARFLDLAQLRFPN